MSCEGEKSHDQAFIVNAVNNHVKFSGMNFPHIMVPLMEEQQMMIELNAFVIYESMEVEFIVELPHPVEILVTFDVEGSRRRLNLIKEDGEVVGKGVKRMVKVAWAIRPSSCLDDLVNRASTNAKRFSSVRSCCIISILIYTTLYK